MGFNTFYPNNMDIRTLHRYLLSSVAPRPIALASTVDGNGRPNLAPFSFFNVFSANPPIMVFSPARRGRDNTTKHTLDNILEVPEVVINLVDYAMVHQVSLASSDFEVGISEFTKSGFEEIDSQLVRPKRVKESPVAYECRVNEVIPLGHEGGAGNLVICEVLCFYFDEAVLRDDGMIDQYKMDLVGRMGENYYVHCIPESIFEVPKPSSSVGIGMDGLPLFIHNNEFLEKNHLARLAGMPSLPDRTEWRQYYGDPYVIEILDTQSSAEDKYDALSLYAAMLLENENTRAAAGVLYLTQEL